MYIGMTMYKRNINYIFCILLLLFVYTTYTFIQNLLACRLIKKAIDKILILTHCPPELDIMSTALRNGEHAFFRLLQWYNQCCCKIININMLLRKSHIWDRYWLAQMG